MPSAFFGTYPRFQLHRYSRAISLESLNMTDPTRREFLAATGCTLVSSAFVTTESHAGDQAGAENSKPELAAFPSHRPVTVPGIHAYTDRVSVAAGDVVRFHVSSSYPYELQVCRLGPDVNGPAHDEVLHSFGPSRASLQPIHPGSYLVAEKPLDSATLLPALTVEVWIRRWRTIGRQAIVTQFDKPNACGLGLFVNEDGSLGFYLGDGGAYVAENLHVTKPRCVLMEVNPQGLKSFPDNTPSSVHSNRWHHVVARFDGALKQLSGRWSRGWQLEVLRLRAARGRESCIGAAAQDGVASEFLDADLAMPTIYGRAVSRRDRGPTRLPRTLPSNWTWASGLLAAGGGTGRACGGRRSSRSARSDHQSGHLDDRRPRSRCGCATVRNL